jgi:eukaryotic-like serine/threonine-protein kinase
MAMDADKTDRHDLIIGSTVGEYRVTERIGGGGMGVVYAAEHPVIGKRVAVKLLRPEVATNESEVQRFVSEARTVCAIGHRGIVDVFGFGTLPDGRHYLLMELLTGEPLDRYIGKRAPLAPLETVDLLDEILDALGAAHRVGVIHRDLKPSNIFYVRPSQGQPYLKLLDFGLAKRSAIPQGSVDQTSNLMMVGTPDYVAPEQARGEPVGPYTDLYSVGILAFEMLTGKVPFRATNAPDIVALQIRQPAPRVSSKTTGVPKQLDDLVNRLLQKRPEARPASATLVRAELAAVKKFLAGDQTLDDLSPYVLKALSPADEADRAIKGTARSQRKPANVAATPEPAPTPEPPPPTTRRSFRPDLCNPWLTAGVGFLVVALGTVGTLRWLDSRTAKSSSLASFPEPAPPPVRAVPDPPPPVKPGTPQDRLLKRVEDLDGKLKKKTRGMTAKADSLLATKAELLLAKIRTDAEHAADAAQVDAVSRDLDTWQTDYLGKP